MSKSKITEAEVRSFAGLARLELSDSEAAELQKQLDAILGYMAELDPLDVSQVEAMFYAVPMDAPLRDDRVQICLPRKEALSQAPKSEAGGFAVPQVLEGE